MVVEGYQVTPALNEVVFSPGCEVNIGNIVIKNVGSMPLPAGALFQFIPNETISFRDDPKFTLPELGPGTTTCGKNIFDSKHVFLNTGEKLQIPTTFFGKIFDVPEPQVRGKYFGHAVIVAQVSLLDKVFPSSVLVTEIPVQYSAKIQSISSSQQVLFNLFLFLLNVFSKVTMNEVVELTILVENNLDNVNSVSLLVNLGPGFRSLDHSNADKVNFPIQLKPRESKLIELSISLKDNAELFKRYTVINSIFSFSLKSNFF